MRQNAPCVNLIQYILHTIELKLNKQPSLIENFY